MNSMKYVNDCNTVCVEVVETEARVSSLQREVDRVSSLLSKAQDVESVQRDRIQSLSQSLQDSNAAHSVNQGRLATLQKNLTHTEQERKQLQVRHKHIHSLIGRI